MLLEVENIAVSYGKIEVLHGISLNVDQAETVVLVGPNGSGKSTTLKAIAGLLKPHQGEIKFKGQPLKKLLTHHVLKKGIALMLQGGRIFPEMSVRENLEMGGFTLTKHEELKNGIDKALILFPRLSDKLYQMAGTLSGGEQQMLAIAMGLMLPSTTLLMLDEPSLGLAPKIVEQVFEHIDKIKSLGISILMAEQNVTMALEIADRGYVLETGLVKLTDNGKNLLKSEKLIKAYLA